MVVAGEASVETLAAGLRQRLGPPPELPDWPLVSIVVLNRDGFEPLRRVTAGLCELTDYPELELILVDNASSDRSLEFMRQVKASFPISILANAHNESFSDGCNQGAYVATGDLLLFLNNDVELFEPGWLRELVACLSESAAAAVGPTLIEPVDDRQPCGGYRIHQRGLRARAVGEVLGADYRDHGEDPLGEQLGLDVDVLAVAGACLLIGREDFEEVGGFTHGYWYGPEDVDLALKLRERGKTVRCSGRSMVLHPPNTTLATIPSDRRREWMLGNRRLFGELWGPRVRREYELDRARGGGLWAEPEVPGSSWGATDDEVDALGFCLKAAALTPDGSPPLQVESLATALRDRGRRAASFCGDEVDSVLAFDYDVAVHLAPAGRYAPKPSQLNLLWLAGEAPPHPLECSSYDLILDGGAGRSGGSIERFAERLIRECEQLAVRRAFRRRVTPAQPRPSVVRSR